MTTPDPAINPAISAEEVGAQALEAAARAIWCRDDDVTIEFSRIWAAEIISAYFSALCTHGAPSEEGRDDVGL